MRIAHDAMPITSGPIEFKPVEPARSTRASKHQPRIGLGLLSAVLLILTTAEAYAQAGPPTPEFTSIVIF